MPNCDFNKVTFGAFSTYVRTSRERESGSIKMRTYENNGGSGGCVSSNVHQ